MENEESALFGSFKKNTSNYYKKLTTTDKRILWILIGAIILALSITGLLSTIRSYDSDLSSAECKMLRVGDVRAALELQEENNILAFLYAFKFLFSFLIIAIGAGWILHGVGFVVVKR